MANAADMLMLQFLRWLSLRPRSYGETMEAWRSSCPRLTTWEDALAEGLVEVAAGGDGPNAGRAVRMTPAGQALLAEQVA